MSSEPKAPPSAGSEHISEALSTLAESVKQWFVPPVSAESGEAAPPPGRQTLPPASRSVHPWWTAGWPSGQQAVPPKVQLATTRGGGDHKDASTPPRCKAAIKCDNTEKGGSNPNSPSDGAAAPPSPAAADAAKISQPPPVTDRPPATSTSPLGFSFSPAGLLLPYHCGVIAVLEDFGYLTPETPIAGASAGALACATHVAGVQPEMLLSALLAVNAAIRRQGAMRKLQRIIRPQLERLLPPDAFQRFNERPAPAAVAFTRVWPPKGIFASKFENNNDLIECLDASCNIPFYFAKWPTVNCRGSPCVDGYFSSPPSHFGCPATGAKRDIRVLPFSPQSVHVHFKDGDHISPGLQKFDNVLDHTTTGRFSRDLANYLHLRRPLDLTALKERQQQRRGSHTPPGKPGGDADSPPPESAPTEGDAEDAAEEEESEGTTVDHQAATGGASGAEADRRQAVEACVKSLEQLWDKAAADAVEGNVQPSALLEELRERDQEQPRSSPREAVHESNDQQQQQNDNNDDYEEEENEVLEELQVDPEAVERSTQAAAAVGKEIASGVDGKGNGQHCNDATKVDEAVATATATLRGEVFRNGWSRHQLLRLALDAAPSDGDIVRLFQLGRADAFRWLTLEKHGGREHSAEVRRRRQVIFAYARSSSSGAGAATEAEHRRE